MRRVGEEGVDRIGDAAGLGGIADPDDEEVGRALLAHAAFVDVAVVEQQVVGPEIGVLRHIGADDLHRPGLGAVAVGPEHRAQGDGLAHLPAAQLLHGGPDQGAGARLTHGLQLGRSGREARIGLEEGLRIDGDGRHRVPWIAVA